MGDFGDTYVSRPVGRTPQLYSLSLADLTRQLREKMEAMQKRRDDAAGEIQDIDAQLVAARRQLAELSQ